MNTLIKTLGLIGVVLLTANCLVLTAPAPAEGAVPRLINYQGKLTDKEGQPLEGVQQVTFRIYTAETGGALLWDETHSIDNLQNGVFNVLLGSVTDLSLDFDQPYWLGIEVATDGEMDPRQQIASAGYAIRAETATNVDSLPSGIIVMWHGPVDAVPQGWALCDGTNGTPDLRDKFVKGLPNASTDPGRTGGFSTHDHGAGSYDGPEHSHSLIQGEYTFSQTDGFIAVSSSVASGHNAGAVAEIIYTNNAGGGSITGRSAEASSLPPYYEIAFITKL